LNLLNKTACSQRLIYVFVFLTVSFIAESTLLHNPNWNLIYIRF